ncbi:Clp protease ClpP [Radiobacillus kanasensis]|uniref:head maturation protease, ClpP-related n=1 Tax=Radiobacillus kanasensis TaxID=2844358 RepID=UPI001E5FC1E2|nr:head maturation protease, ClpP-related [Radiobacillus kanasensis]UFU00363.1 Clp protease ClpP [Radiobacillus kanasensis]
MTRELKEQIKNMMNKKSDIRFEAVEEGKEYSLYIYGPIGSYFYSDNSAQGIQRKLQNVDADKIHVHINSPGGSAFDGVAIGNILKNHKAEIIVHIDGWAASAASVIAVAGDKVIMPENTMMMIHRAATFEYGNATVFEKTAADLRKIDISLAASYKKRFVGEESELEQLLDEETFLTAEEAVAFGLADVVGEEIEIQDLEDIDVDEDDTEPENIKEKLVAKYVARAKPNQKEPTPNSVENSKVSKLFLNL